MKQLYILLLLLSSVAGFAQVEKDSLLKADYDVVLEKVTLMHYLDQKAMQLLTKDIESKKELDKNFRAFYTDSIVAGNPTSIDVHSYLNYKPSKYPKNLQAFANTVFKYNAAKLLELTTVYGYLSFDRGKFVVEKNKVFYPVQFTLHTSEFDKKITRIFESEYKSGNMPIKDYIFYSSIKNNKILTEEEVKRLEGFGIKQDSGKVNPNRKN